MDDILSETNVTSNCTRCTLLLFPSLPELGDRIFLATPPLSIKGVGVQVVNGYSSVEWLQSNPSSFRLMCLLKQTSRCIEAFRYRSIER